MAELLEVIKAIGIGLPVVFALCAWLGKVWAARILEGDRKKYAERLEAFTTDEIAKRNAQLKELEKGQLVHRLQFEAEFKCYQALWVTMVELRRAVLALRPALDLEIVDKKARLGRYESAFLEARDAFALNGPFLHPTVFAACDVLLKRAHEENIDFVARSEQTVEYWDSAIRNATAIGDAVDSVSGAIRARIGNA